MRAFGWVVGIALAAALLGGCGTEEDRVVGTWQGSVDLSKVPQAKMLPPTARVIPVTVHFKKDKDGKLAGTLESSLQKGSAALDPPSIKDGALQFRISRINASYSARLSQDGKELAGQWQQAGLTLPLTLKKTD